jgi:hypothetical protein
MKSLLVLFFTLLSLTSFAQGHPAHHAKHGFFLYGDKTLYASHIVYKVPHNYQVILRITPQDDLQLEYNKAKSLEPANKFIFVFDHMDLSKIESYPTVTGILFSEDQNGDRRAVSGRLELTVKSYEILYFSELPAEL